MRIGLVLDVVQSYTSGVTTFASLLKPRLECLGCDVSVFAFGNPHHSNPNSGVHISPGILLSNGYAAGLGFSRPAQKMMRQMDVLHLQHPFLSGPIARRAVRGCKIPLVFTNHTRYDLYIQSYIPILPPATARHLLSAYMPGFCGSMDLVISPSAGIRDVMRSWGVTCPISVVPNGVDLLPFQNPIGDIHRAVLGFQETDIIWAFVGRLAPEKNPSLLAQSFIQIFKRCPEAALLIIGDGPEKDAISTLFRSAGYAHRVHFTGLLEYDKIPGYLAVADGFTTASVSEVHPLTLIEAMAAGLPLVGIHSPGVADLIQDHSNGLLASSEANDYVRCICELTQNHALRTSLGERAKHASSQYSIDQTARCMMEHYKNAIDAKKSNGL